MRLPQRLLIACCLTATPAAAFGEEGSCAQITDMLPALEIQTDPQLELTADDVDLSADGLSRLLGSVRLRQGDKEISAEAVDYDESRQSVSVNAESTFRSRELLIRSQAAQFSLSDETGSFSDTEFVLSQRAARGDSARISLARDGTADLSGVRYTTCAPQSNAWYLEAGNIHLDHEEGLGTARHARLRLFGVPLFYTPWIQFPLDDRRRTGLLFPTVGRSDKTGWDYRQPLYVNLAPNYDLMLTPRWMSDRGLQLSTEGRYLLPQSEGTLGYEFLNKDRKTDRRQSYGYFSHRGLINDRLGADIRYAEVNDRRYFEEFGGNIDLTSITHLERSARFTYAAPAAYTVQLLFQDYQTIASNLTTDDDPYQRMPQIKFDAITRNALWDTRLGFDGEYVNFARSGNTEGQRIDLHPYLRLEKDRVAWYVKSQASFRYTAYVLDTPAAGASSQPDRSLPTFSAESGLRFERLTDSGALQTLEPRIFYLFTPYENQDNLPVFDSGEPDFDFTQLFARNRFSGADRISDANQLALALTGRQLESDSGIVRISASVGQLFRFESPEVQLPDGSAPDKGATDFIGNLTYQMTSRVRLALDTQWSPESADFTRSSVSMRYRDGQRLLQLAYRYRVNQLEQTDLLLSTPLAAGFSAVARWRYSIEDNTSVDTVAGIQYETCCWGIQTSYRRYVRNTAGEINTGIYLQLELKGLASVGTGIENLLPRTAVE